MKILLKNAQIVSTEGIEVKDVLIVDDKIEKIDGNIDVKADREYDLTGKYILPGCIDAHVHFRTPGYNHKEDWRTGSRAALAGGITTVFDMPNTKPNTTTLQALADKRELIQPDALVNYGLFFGATLTNLEDCKKAKGNVGFKVYMGATTGHEIQGEVDQSADLLEKMFNNVDKVVAIHAEDESLMKDHAEIYKGDNTPEVHSLIRSDETAAEAAKKALHLAKKCGGRMHLCHMSTKKEVELMKKFGSDKVTCEVTPHHLFLGIKDYVKFGNYIKVNPPVRGQHDQDILWEGLQNRIITMIATDHAPHLPEEKELSYNKAPAGIPELDTSLALMLNAVNDERLELSDVVNLMSSAPAKVYGLKGKGAVKEGYDADLTVVDMSLMLEVENDKIFSKCGWSPYDGWRLKGWPVMTFVRGKLGMLDREIVESEGVKGKEVELI